MSDNSNTMSNCKPPCDFFLFSSALMCVLDANGVIVQINPAWEKKFNIIGTELEQSNYMDWVHPADKVSSGNYLAQLGIKPQSQSSIENQKVESQSLLSYITFSNRWRDCARHYHWLNWEINAVSGQNSFYAVAQDITAQKHAEKLLGDTEERFELAIQGADHGLWDWNLETNEIYLSPRWKNMLGYQDHEIANHLDEWCRFVHPDDFAQMWATIEAYLDKRMDNYESIYRVYHKDGNYRWILARAATRWDNNDQPYRMVGTYTDITKRKHIEEALQESEALLSAIFEVTKLGLCITNKEGQFVRVNPACCALYGYTAEEMLGQHFTLIIAPENHERAIKLH